VYSGIYQDAAHPCSCYTRGEKVYAASLDVDAGDFGVVVSGEDAEFDGAAPSGGFEDCCDVLRWGHSVWGDGGGVGRRR